MGEAVCKHFLSPHMRFGVIDTCFVCGGKARWGWNLFGRLRSDENALQIVDLIGKGGSLEQANTHICVGACWEHRRRLEQLCMLITAFSSTVSKEMVEVVRNWR